MRASPWSFPEARDYARSFGFANPEEYKEYRCPGAYALPRDPESAFPDEFTSWGDYLGVFSRVLFVETGVGCDQHGQNVTKAAVRAARQAIEFNSIPCIAEIVPGGYDNMLLRIDVAAPASYHDALDLEQIKKVFPYGNVIGVRIQNGGAIFKSGIAIEAMGDTSEDMVIVNVGVTVGY